MKFSGEFVSLVVPFLNLGANNTNNLGVPSLQLRDTYENISYASQTWSSSVPLATHHHHHHHEDDEHQDHREEHGHHEHHRERLRPRAGDASLGVSAAHGGEVSSECPQPPVLSCSPQAASADTCCVVSPGGVLVHAQFWDLGVGQADSWGIHGLWPDKCNGAFYEKCDSSRAYSGSVIKSAIQSAGQTALLDYMNTYWLSDDDSPEEFWSHEWEEHGTCVSTLEPSCFANYQKAQEVVPYFQTVVNIFQKLNTYQALASTGIVPSDTATYALADLQSAVQSTTGFTPDFVCNSNTSELTTVQYYLNAYGPLQNGQLVQSAPSRDSSCPDDGIVYPIKQLSDGS